MLHLAFVIIIIKRQPHSSSSSLLFIKYGGQTALVRGEKRRISSLPAITDKKQTASEAPLLVIITLLFPSALQLLNIILFLCFPRLLVELPIYQRTLLRGYSVIALLELKDDLISPLLNSIN